MSHLNCSQEKNKPMVKLFLNEQERFWDKVDKTGGPNCCWLWKGSPNMKGYGRFSFRCYVYKAHRVAYFLANGRIDDNLMVLHHCDVRLCCNPTHLYQGDAKQNTQDALNRGRYARIYGIQNGNAKLTEMAVKSIRQRYNQGHITQKSLAQYFGVCETTIYYICKGERWINIPIE
jgi:DNA-binding XRE family transcriptional regulator